MYIAIASWVDLFHIGEYRQTTFSAMKDAITFTEK